MRPLATDTHDFPSLRRDGCIYVDKTMFIHRLITTVGTKLFFISRPRRFGKSLTISALKAIFQGRRELFEGLAIVLRVDPERMTGIPASEFDVAELRRLRPVAMLFQSGYLTIKDYDPLAEAYTLGVPDEEVRRDLCTLMTGAVAHKSLVRLQDTSSGRLRV